MSLLSRFTWLVLISQIFSLSLTPLYAAPRGDHGVRGERHFKQRSVVCRRGEVHPGCVAPVRKTFRAAAGAVGFVARTGVRGVAWAGRTVFRAARFLLFGRFFR